MRTFRTLVAATTLAALAILVPASAQAASSTTHQTSFSSTSQPSKVINWKG